MPSFNTCFLLISRSSAGGSDDWAHGVAEVPYSYTVELRDKGRYGFLLPKQQIVPTGEEFSDGMKAMAHEIRADS